MEALTLLTEALSLSEPERIDKGVISEGKLLSYS